MKSLGSIMVAVYCQPKGINNDGMIIVVETIGHAVVGLSLI